MKAKAARSRVAVRRGERGLTLIEMLVVLAIIGAVASVSALSLGSTSGQDGMAEAARLKARLQLAADQALIEDRPVALAVRDDGYAFLEWDSENSTWRAATLPALEELHRLPGRMVLRGHANGTVLPIDPDSAGRGFSLTIEGEGRVWTVDFDGVTARSGNSSPPSSVGDAR